MLKQMRRKPLQMQAKKHQKNNSKKLRGWVLSQSLFVLSVSFLFNYNILTDARHSQNTNTTHTLRTFHTLHAAPDRNGCWLQSSVFVRTACAALGTSPSFDAQPTLHSSTAWQSNMIIYACGKTPKTPPPQAPPYAPYSNTTSDQNAAYHQPPAAAPSPAAPHHSPAPQQPQLQGRSSQK